MKISKQRHERILNSDRPFRYPKCDYKCSTSSDLKRHEGTHTGSGKPFSCSQCGYTCSTSSDLKRHKRTHTGYSQCCYKCTILDILSKHERTHTGSTIQLFPVWLQMFNIKPFEEPWKNPRMVINHAVAPTPSVTSNSQYQVIWRGMKEPTLVVNHLAAPSVATHAQHQVI